MNDVLVFAKESRIVDVGISQVHKSVGTIFDRVGSNGPSSTNNLLCGKGNHRDRPSLLPVGAANRRGLEDNAKDRTAGTG